MLTVWKGFHAVFVLRVIRTVSLMDWQDTFMQLYTSTSLEDGHKAFELKRDHIP